MIESSAVYAAPSRGGVWWHWLCHVSGAGDVAMGSFIQTQSDGFVPQLGRSISIDQAARLLGVSRRTIYNRIKDGRLSTLRTRGGSQRVLLASLQQFVMALPPAVTSSRRAIV